MRLVIVILALSSTAFGQQESLRLSLARAVDIALTPEGSARIALAEQSIERASTQVAQAKSALLPTIDGGVQDRSQTTNLRTFGFNFDIPGFVFPSVVGPFTVVDARAQARWNVLDFTALKRYRAAKGGVDSSKADLEVTRTQVSDQVARAYLATLRADAALEAAQANLELSEALRSLAQSQKDAGTGTGIEITRAQVQLANDNGRLLIVRNDRARAALQLLRAMGLDLALPVLLTDKLAYTPVDTKSIEASLTEARLVRVEMKAQKQKEAVARLNYSAIAAERLPSVATFGDYGSIGQPKIGLAATHTVGVSVSIPILDGGRRKARRQESTSQILTEEIRTRDLEQQIELEVRLAIESLQSAQALVSTAREGLDLAQNEVEQARRRYQAGVSVPLEVTDAQARLDRARDNQIVALYSYNLARLDLAVATGHIQDFVHP
ncbi:MAG: TolC family protein [Acidobacteriota bacterium]